MLNLVEPCCTRTRRNSLELLNPTVYKKCESSRKTFTQLYKERLRCGVKYLQNIIIEIDHDCSVEQMIQFIDNGATAFYFNLANGSPKGENSLFFNKIKEIPAKKKPSIILGVSGRTPITGRMCNDKEVKLRNLHKIILTADRRIASRSSRAAVYANCYDFIALSNPGHIIGIGDEIKLFVLKKSEYNLVCVVKRGGILKANLELSFPDIIYELCVTHEELEDLNSAFTNNIDIVVLPDCENYYCAKSVRKIIDVRGKYVMMMTHVKKGNVKRCADAELLAKAYCGIIVKLEQIPKLTLPERKLIEYFVSQKKPVIVEVTDFNYLKSYETILKRDLVYLHVYPDAFCIKKPIRADPYYINFTDDLNEHTAKFLELNAEELKHDWPDLSRTETQILLQNAAKVTVKTEAKIILILTNSGRRAISLSHYHPSCLILAITPNNFVASKLPLYRSIKVFLYTKKKTHKNWILARNNIINNAMEYALEQNYCQLNDPAILLLKSKCNSNQINYQKITRIGLEEFGEEGYV